MNLQITAVIDLVDRRQRMKIRRGSGRTQFVSFNFPNNLIWAAESTGRMQIAAGRTRRWVFRVITMRFGVGSLKSGVPLSLIRGGGSYKTHFIVFIK
jgi:hypothetical protein